MVAWATALSKTRNLIRQVFSPSVGNVDELNVDDLEEILLRSDVSVRLAMDIADDAENPLETLLIGLARFRRPIREYFAICDSYYQAIRKATPAEIETIDMARRGIHNDAAELLVERLDGKVETDFATSRRLFTLICVLHIKG